MMYYSDKDDNKKNRCMDDKKDKCMKMEYGKAYVLPQKYENLINVKFALDKGTIFKDLICPYKGKRCY